jgi:nicotinate-nucleotide pyrophosphorylase (carboxylating)
VLRFDPPDLSRLIATALDEDNPSGDITTDAIVGRDTFGSARLLAREAMVVCGLHLFGQILAAVDPRVEVELLVVDGHRSLGADEELARVTGPLRAILTGERPALNLVQRLSGIATRTRRHVDRIADLSARLVDTRKTTPGLRAAEKYAVRVGGGHNHRFSLSDGVMIKDNHIAAAGSITEAVRRAQARVHHLLRIQVEVESLEEAHEAVDAGARVLLLDNFEASRLAEVVAVLRARPETLILEASGGIDLTTIRSVAETGVDVISCGGLVHQAAWKDVSLAVVREGA